MFVANDPYHGGGHLPDYNVFAPVFADDAATGTRRMVLIASHPVPPRRHRRRRARRLQRHRQRHLGRGRALAGRQGHRPGRRAPRRALRAAGQQPPARLHRRPARPDRRGPARRGPPRRDHRPPRHRRGRGVGRLHDRLRRPALLARRSRPGPTASYEADCWVDHDPLGQPRRPPARDRHRRRRPADDRLHRQRHPPGAPGVVDLRQHPRVHGRPDRRHDGSRDPEERGLLRARSTWSCPRAACSTRVRATGRCRPAPTTPAPTSARSSPWRCSTCCPTRRCPRSTRPASRP